MVSQLNCVHDHQLMALSFRCDNLHTKERITMKAVGVALTFSFSDDRIPPRFQYPTCFRGWR